MTDPNHSNAVWVVVVFLFLLGMAIIAIAVA